MSGVLVWRMLLTVLALAASDGGECDPPVENCMCNDIMECSGLSTFPPAQVGLAGLKLAFTDCHFGAITDLPLEYQSADTLIIRRSEVTSIRARVFQFFTNLKTLHLDGNFITNITKETLYGLRNLENLNMNGNRLTGLAGDFLENTPGLVELQLGDNQGLQLPDSLLSGLQLKTLRLSGCLLTSVPTALVSGVSSLQSLYLSGNGFPHVPRNSFRGLSALKVLSLDTCSIETLEAGAFAGLNNLNMLVLSHNQLMSLTSDVTSPFRGSIETLLLDHNHLYTLSEDLLEWDGLKNLALGHNPWICECHLHWLHSLDLKHLDHENVTCIAPPEDMGKPLHNVTSASQPCPTGSGHALALGIVIPILIICLLLIGYYVYRIMQSRRQRELARRSYPYSAVYKDTVETTPSKSPPPRPPAPRSKSPTYLPVV